MPLRILGSKLHSAPPTTQALTFLQLPAFLFLTLSHCFWFSFSGFPFQVPPTRWPIIWVIFTISVMINPLPVFYRSSRMWLLRTLGSLFISGSRGVEVRSLRSRCIPVGDDHVSSSKTSSSATSFVAWSFQSRVYIPLDVHTDTNGNSHWITALEEAIGSFYLSSVRSHL